MGNGVQVADGIAAAGGGAAAVDDAFETVEFIGGAALH